MGKQWRKWTNKPHRSGRRWRWASGTPRTSRLWEIFRLVHPQLHRQTRPRPRARTMCRCRVRLPGWQSSGRFVRVMLEVSQYSHSVCRFRISHFTGCLPSWIVKLLLSIFLLAGTGVGWAFSIIMLRKSSQNIDPKQDDTGFSGSNSQIFVHVAFGVVALAQLVLLERLTFRVRAERYAFKHPGEMLRRGGPMSASMPMVRCSELVIAWRSADEDILRVGALAASSAPDIRSCARAEWCTHRRCRGRTDRPATTASVRQDAREHPLIARIPQQRAPPAYTDV